mmetsp:Transcript_41541/g.90503  ORF Transcript_41541/g.90503 Transcript_41541/m.90503 type:complete len:229 (+) Transcript_41541:841-1527(+)
MFVVLRQLRRQVSLQLRLVIELQPCGHRGREQSPFATTFQQLIGHLQHLNAIFLHTGTFDLTGSGCSEVEDTGLALQTNWLSRATIAGFNDQLVLVHSYCERHVRVLWGLSHGFGYLIHRITLPINLQLRSIVQRIRTRVRCQQRHHHLLDLTSPPPKMQIEMLRQGGKIAAQPVKPQGQKDAQEALEAVHSHSVLRESREMSPGQDGFDLFLPVGQESHADVWHQCT